MTLPSPDQVFGWLDKHNGAVTAIATVVLALITLFVWRANQRLVRATAKATGAAERAAKAAEDEAKASREAMELDWRPVLTFHHSTESHTITGAWVTTYPVTYIRNVGRGPALNVRFLHRKDHEDSTREWQMTKRFSLAGGDTVSDHAWVKTDPSKGVPHQGEPADEVWGGAFPTVKEVLICQDQAGHLYRFIDPEPVPEEWREGVEPVPAWVNWYRTWLAYD